MRFFRLLYNFPFIGEGVKSGSGPRDPYNPGGGPGVAAEIDPGEVPLADLPNEIPTEIPQEEVPLAGLPKTGQSRNAGR